jgi:hypothetical protein
MTATDNGATSSRAFRRIRIWANANLFISLVIGIFRPIPFMVIFPMVVLVGSFHSIRPQSTTSDHP